MKTIKLIGLLWLPLFSAAQNNAAVTLALTVNDGQQATVYKTEPVLLTISVSNKNAQYAFLGNMQVNRRLKEIAVLLENKKINQQQYDDEKKQLEAEIINTPAVTLGNAANPWFSLLQWTCVYKKNGTPVNISITRLPVPPPDTIAVLDANGYYTAYFGYGAGLLSAGEYAISVSLPGGSEATVELVVEQGERPVKKTTGDVNSLLPARYYWHAAEPLKALAVLNDLLQKDSLLAGALSLRGDVYAEQKKYAEALKDYRAALKLYNRSSGPYSEPPEYLLAMIDWVKSKMER